MYLKKITFKNYRCFENLEIDLDRRLTVLVGENGAGKTAVLDGIAAALSPVLRHLESVKQKLPGRPLKADDIRILTGGGIADYAQVVAQAVVDDTEVQWGVGLSGASRKSPPKVDGENAFAQCLQRISDSYNSKEAKVPPVIAYYDTALRGHAGGVKWSYKTTADFSRPESALLGALDSLRDFSGMQKWFDDEETWELRINSDRAKAFVELPTLTYVRSCVNESLLNAYHSPKFTIDRKLELVRHSDGELVRLQQLSQGFRSMFAMTMDFARRQAIANVLALNASEQMEVSAKISLMRNTPSIMLIDEIDLHLHPSWQQRVIGDLMRTFPLTQFIVTTHSPQVLSTVKRESIRRLGHNIDGQAIAEPPLARTYGMPSGDVLKGVMHVDPQPPIPETKKLQRLTELVDQGLYTSDEAEQLTKELNALFGESHPQLLRLQLSIRRQEFLKS